MVNFFREGSVLKVNTEEGKDIGAPTKVLINATVIPVLDLRATKSCRGTVKSLLSATTKVISKLIVKCLKKIYTTNYNKLKINFSNLELIFIFTVCDDSIHQSPSDNCSCLLTSTELTQMSKLTLPPFAIPSCLT